MEESGGHFSKAASGRDAAMLSASEGGDAQDATEGAEMDISMWVRVVTALLVVLHVGGLLVVALTRPLRVALEFGLLSILLAGMMYLVLRRTLSRILQTLFVAPRLEHLRRRAIPAALIASSSLLGFLAAILILITFTAFAIIIGLFAMLILYASEEPDRNKALVTGVTDRIAAETISASALVYVLTLVVSILMALVTEVMRFVLGVSVSGCLHKANSDGLPDAAYSAMIAFISISVGVAAYRNYMLLIFLSNLHARLRLGAFSTLISISFLILSWAFQIAIQIALGFVSVCATVRAFERLRMRHSLARAEAGCASGCKSCLRTSCCCCCCCCMDFPVWPTVVWVPSVISGTYGVAEELFKLHFLNLRAKFTAADFRSGAVFLLLIIIVELIAFAVAASHLNTVKRVLSEHSETDRAYIMSS
uniref:Uncharacterized protein n=1 Tax=Erythrolobus australicus TaxID=1077150 RepID=A0A7S1TKV3_9RHOD|mmetsp:Transcript_3091/g.8599  ORF Transcript_3091/g.8599 Transcript_3091/m.8599 type:complete len:422 (+) Transcript_3091:28-1293(+)